MNLTARVILGMALGILVGLAINMTGMNTADGFVNFYLVDGFFFVVGKVFVNALKMLVVPLVLFSLLSQVLTDIVPTNPVSAMPQGEMLSIIFFAILVGISILMVGKRAVRLVDMVEILNEIMMKMVGLIMALAPYAVFCLLARAMSNLGLDLLCQVLGYVVVLIDILMFHLFLTLTLVLKLFSGLSVPTLLKKIRSFQVFASSTSSSNATIPVTLRTVTKRLGVDNSVASFTVPFGATINMDGTPAAS